MSESKVQVFVRIRPLVDELGETYKQKCAKKAADDSISMTHPADDSANSGKQTTYRYNQVFDEDDTQEDLYSAVAPLVDSTLDGHDATIFTYGQTGSGKTHTVLGTIGERDGVTGIGTQTGLYLRVLDDLLRYKHANKAHSHVVIALTMIEIYLDEVRDLLNIRNKLELKTNKWKDDSPYLPVVREVESLAQCIEAYETGSKERAVGSTKCNLQSSRSHALFTIDVLQQEKNSDNQNTPPNAAETYANDFITLLKEDEPKWPIRRSRLCLVDLAGSERVKKSGAEGGAFNEAVAINSSLTALGNVVSALYKGEKFVNYRDCTLTQLFKPSFKHSSSKILLITNISPVDSSFQESLGSMKFADRVMSLKAKQVFMMDAHSEVEYLDSLRLQAELTSDLRIAMAMYSMKLQGTNKLRQLKGQKKAIHKEAVQQLVAEYKEQQEDVNKQEFRNLVDKYVNRRPLAEAREKRELTQLQWEVQLEEQELVQSTLLSEEMEHQSEILIRKSLAKDLRKIVKASEQVMEQYKVLLADRQKEYDHERTSAIKLTNTIDTEEESFAVSDNPPPLPPPLPAEPEPAVTKSKKKNAKVVFADADKLVSEAPDKPLHDHSPTANGTPPAAAVGSRRESTTREMQEAEHQRAMEIRAKRESVKSTDSTELRTKVNNIMKKKKKNDDGEDMEDDSGEDESSQVALDSKRLKKLYKETGFSKEEIAKLLSRSTSHK